MNRRIGVGALFVAVAVLVLLFVTRGDDEQPEGKSREIADKRKSVVPAPAPAATPAPLAPIRKTPSKIERARVTEVKDVVGGRFLGRVLNVDTNEVIAGAELVFAREGIAESVVADTKGGFRFEPAEEGQYQLAVVSADGFFSYAPAWEQSPIVLIARPDVQVAGIDVYLTPRVMYSGNVVDSVGASIAGATIRISSTKENVLGEDDNLLKSDADGQFEFYARDNSLLTATHGQDSGSARVDSRTQTSRHVEITIGIDASSDPWQEVGSLPDEKGGARLLGRVVDADDNPVPSFNVMLTRQKGIASTVLKERVFFDASGEFVFDAVLPGRYQVHASAAGWAGASATGVAKVDRPTPVTLRLSNGATLFGSVVDAESRDPVAQSKISLEGVFGGATSARPILATTVTDKAGQFELSGLRAGRRSVIVSSSHHDTRIVSALQVIDGERHGPMLIELTPRASDQEPVIELVGIGAILEGVDDGAKVKGMVDGGGAKEAGMEVGDVIVAIDGDSVSELGWDDSMQRIRGLADSQVHLDIKRGDRLLGLEVTRRAIRF